MWEPVKALEDRNPVDQLACLVLRVLAELTPCTERLFKNAFRAATCGHSRDKRRTHIRESLFIVPCSS